MVVNPSLAFSQLSLDSDRQQRGTTMDTFIYEPLDTTAHSIRLVELEPAQDINAPIVCKLIHQTFGDKPKYYALSYNAGDQSQKNIIFVNGKKFAVGGHLCNALVHLRNRGDGLLFWIDAICINHDDIQERNRQLHIIPHIYTRAKTVSIWLGVKVEFGKKTFGQEMCEHEYWKRVWTSIELVKARKVEVVGGETTMSWEEFVDRMKPHFTTGKHECGPSKIIQKMNDKYKGGQNLRQLLEGHENSICNEPRDKIYGFVGLATECHEFPMDYEKSLFQVWKDTVAYATSTKLVSSTDVLPFAKLVKKLLGPATIDQALREMQPLPSQPREVKEEDDTSVIRFKARLAGKIVHLGPSPDELISDLSETSNWTGAIQKQFKTDLGEANKENDLFLEALEECDEDQLATALSVPVVTEWAGDSKLQRNCVNPAKSTDQVISHKTELQLYLMQPTHKRVPWRMGVAPANAQEGEWIFWAPGIQRAMLVHRTSNHNKAFQIIGTVLASKELFSIPELESFEKVDSDYLYDLVVDTGIMYLLLGEFSTKSS
jgi:hypothetical protein